MVSSQPTRRDDVAPESRLWTQSINHLAFGCSTQPRSLVGLISPLCCGEQSDKEDKAADSVAGEHAEGAAIACSEAKKAADWFGERIQWASGWRAEQQWQ